MYEAPSQVLAYRIAERWELTEGARDVLAGQTTANPRYSPIWLPSKRKQTNHGSLFLDTGTSLTLEWQSEAPTYKNDISIYVWQPHLEKHPALYNSVNLVIAPSSSSGDTFTVRRIAVVLKPPTLLNDSEPQGRLLPSVSEPSQASHSWVADHEFFRILLSFFERMTTDSAKFLDGLQQELRDLVSTKHD